MIGQALRAGDQEATGHAQAPQAMEPVTHLVAWIEPIGVGNWAA